MGHGTNPLNFYDDLDPDPDPGSAISKTTRRIFMKFSEEVDMGHGTNPLNFGDDPDPDPDSGSTVSKNYWTDLHEIFRGG